MSDDCDSVSDDCDSVSDDGELVSDDYDSVNDSDNSKSEGSDSGIDCNDSVPSIVTNQKKIAFLVCFNFIRFSNFVSYTKFGEWLSTENTICHFRKV